MRSPSKAAFLRTVALVFLLCIISSVFARAPLVRRQSTVESQWDQGLPAVADGPKMKNNILNEQVVADPYRVCCTRKETLIAKVFSVCEDGMSFYLNFDFFFFFFSNPSTHLYLPIPSSYVFVREKSEEKGREPHRESKS